ncbi:MAG: PTS sugar transporter subunit IIA [Proteobacteria bacterium]|nr:PTS sugar transporter subunit IIA [Pseudomonadota bacterium]
MKIKSFLRPESVLIDLRVPDKPALLRALAQVAANTVHVSSESVFTEIARREELGSTGIGEGVAIPHARVAGVEKAFALAARLRPPVNFDSIDGRPVDLVFLLVAPQSSNTEHLNLLAAVSRKLRDRSVVEQLRTSVDAEDFYRALTAE